MYQFSYTICYYILIVHVSVYFKICSKQPVFLRVLRILYFVVTNNYEPIHELSHNDVSMCRLNLA